MLGSHSLRWIIFLVFAALSVLGCVGSTDAPQGETGSLSLDLVLADGTLIDEVDWRITGNGMDMSGTIDVTAPGSTASVEVFGLPKGEENYTIALEALSVDGEVSCRGSEPFNVEPGETTDVMVMLNCKLPQRLGAVRVNGKFNICAELVKAVVSPLQTSVGNDIDLASQAVDQEGDPITYTWTATGGTIADPTAASTTYTCVDVGNHFVNISVTDNDEVCDMAEWTIPVTCVQGDGGTGGSGGDGGTGGQGGAGGEAGAGGGGGAGGAGGQGGAGGGIDPDIVCNEGVCLTDAGKKAECVAFLIDCLENSPDLNDDECVIGALLICEPDPCDIVDCSDGLECTADVCTEGVCSNPPVTDGTMCDNNMGVCELGVCAPADLCVGKDCSDGNECTQDLCDAETGICSNPSAADGTECTCPVCGAEGLCMMGECVDPCEGVDCSDGNQCTADLCGLGVCSNPNVGPGAACDQDGGVVCDGSGNCVECVSAEQCPSDGNECTVASCSITGVCGQDDVDDGTSCEGGAGTCDGEGNCVVVALPTCGDGNLDGPSGTYAGENCDDGNTDPIAPANPGGSFCGQDSDCPEAARGQTCNLNADPGGSACGDAGGTACTSNDDCPVEGQVCDTAQIGTAGTCIVWGDGTSGPCPLNASGQECDTSGVCLPRNTSCNPITGDTCAADCVAQGQIMPVTCRNSFTNTISEIPFLNTFDPNGVITANTAFNVDITGAGAVDAGFLQAAAIALFSDGSAASQLTSATVIFARDTITAESGTTAGANVTFDKQNVPDTLPIPFVPNPAPGGETCNTDSDCPAAVFSQTCIGAPGGTCEACDINTCAIIVTGGLDVPISTDGAGNLTPVPGSWTADTTANGPVVFNTNGAVPFPLGAFAAPGAEDSWLTVAAGPAGVQLACTGGVVNESGTGCPAGDNANNPDCADDVIDPALPGTLIEFPIWPSP